MSALWTACWFITYAVLLWVAVAWFGAAPIALTLAILSIALLGVVMRSDREHAAELERIRELLLKSERESAAWSDRILDRIEHLEETAHRTASRVDGML